MAECKCKQAQSHFKPTFVSQLVNSLWASQVALVSNNMPANAGSCKRPRFDPWVGKIPWRRIWQPTPILLPGESHRQRSLAGYRSCGVKGKSYCLMYKVFPREALLFPINIAEDRTKGSGALFCVSSLGPAVGGLVFIAF